MIDYEGFEKRGPLLLQELSLEENPEVQEKLINNELFNYFVKGFFKGLERKKTGKELNKQQKYRIGQQSVKNFLTTAESIKLQNLILDKMKDILVQLGYEESSLKMVGFKEIIKKVMGSFYLAGVLQGVELDKSSEEEFNYFIELLKTS